MEWVTLRLHALAPAQDWERQQMSTLPMPRLSAAKAPSSSTSPSPPLAPPPPPPAAGLAGSPLPPPLRPVVISKPEGLLPVEVSNAFSNAFFAKSGLPDFPNPFVKDLWSARAPEAAWHAIAGMHTTSSLYTASGDEFTVAIAPLTPAAPHRPPFSERADKRTRLAPLVVPVTPPPPSVSLPSRRRPGPSSAAAPPGAPAGGPTGVVCASVPVA